MSNSELQSEKILRDELIGKESSETYHKNYLIEAGAGAGKTYIMVNRIVNQLLDGEILPEHLAAITFTEKATQEMLERIDSELINRYRKLVEETGSESAESVRLRKLLDSVDQMQVSTIHSFCRKLLMTMPYESALGPEFEVVEDIETYAGDFFDRMVMSDSTIFDRAKKITGVSFEDLKHNFVRLCESGAEIQCKDIDSDEINRRLDEMTQIANLIHAHLVEAADMRNVKNVKSKGVQQILPQIREVLRLKDRPREEFAQALFSAVNPLIKADSINKDAVIRVFPGAIKDNKAITGAQIDRIKEIWGEVIHALCMTAIRDLIVEYRAYKKQNRVASQNDLLLCTRDMLKNSAEARSYFHNRYQAIYVDEMQDTDPIQAQILFYLTTDEADFHAEDWRKCKPVPGSLFLVGDPKQAIYRFRGADISVYLILSELFENGIGENVKLHYNYRSSSEITDFADRAFTGAMNGGEYQAEYSAMTAVHGSSGHARLVGYREEENSAPERVAAFIAKAVEAKTIVGTVGNEHAAQYSDFMILTRTNASTEPYVKELAKYGIPCNMSGSKKFADVQPISRANLILQYLMDQKDETKLALVLVNCYGISLPTLRSYRQRAGKLTVGYLSAKKALLEEGSIRPEYEPIFSAMEELQGLCQLIGHVPAMTVMETIFFKTAGIWNQDAAADRSGDYAMVSQYLKKLRETGYVSFPALAADAIELSEGKAERELLLEEKENCVKIMNLHKAKGLEAEIVILAYDSQFKSNAVKHTAFDGNTMRLHSCITRSNGHGGENILASEPGWAETGGPKEEEEAFLRAEIVRLLYVAATRAKTCLIVNTADGSAWEELGKAIHSSEGDMELADDYDDFSELVDDAADEDADTDSEICIDEDPGWNRAIRALNTAQSSVGEIDESKDMSIRNISATEMEKELMLKAADAADCGSVYITPSKLERSQRRQLKREEEDDSNQADIEVEENADSLHGAETEEIADIPHGADWGTIMHRTLELVVKSDHKNPETVRKYARQAITEVLGDCKSLSMSQRNLLLGRYTLADGETLEGYLLAQAVNLAGFICDPESEYRKLIDGAVCYAELPFILQEQDMTTGLAIAVNSITGEKSGKPININGVIDLAIKKQDGWTIVDYKTDILMSDEKEEEYIKRVKQQYSPQLMAYRDVLMRLGKGDVRQVYICALALDGKLILIL